MSTSSTPSSSRKATIRRFSAQEIAAGQLLAHASRRHAIRRALNALEPNANGTFSLLAGSEPERFVTSVIRKHEEGERIGSHYAVRVCCPPKHVCFLVATFEEAVAVATPFERLFPVRITAC